MRQLQRELNEAGYTDKFGLPIREDGLYGGKTAYANDSKKAVEESNTTANVETYSTDTTSTTDNVAEQTNTEQSTSQRVGNRANLPSRGRTGNSITTYPATANASGPMVPVYEPVANILNNSENIKVASLTGIGEKGILESVDPKGNVRKYNEKIKENANMNGKPEWNIRRASNIISKNSEAIKAAGKKYGVNPSIIAACIYTEQIVNYNIGDVIADKMYWRNPSVGIGQVQIATAQSIEDKGLVEKTKYLGKMQDWHANGYVEKDAWQIPGYGIFLGTKEEAIAKRLNIDEQCIEYVGAYLKLIQDLWKDAYPIIDGKSDILATLYNMGEYGGSRGINSSPKPSPFGNTAKANYYHMQYLLSIE